MAAPNGTTATNIAALNAVVAINRIEQPSASVGKSFDQRCELLESWRKRSPLCHNTVASESAPSLARKDQGKALSWYEWA